MFKTIKNYNLTKQDKTVFIISTLIAIAGLVLLPSFLDLIAFLGQRIPQKQIRLDYLKGILWSLILGLTIFKWPVLPQDKRPLMIAWAVKCFVMLGFMLFYEFHYSVDSYNYFLDGALKISEWGSMYVTGSSAIVAFITWLHQHSFFNSYHAAKVSFGMIGLIGIYIFYRSIIIFLKQERIRLFYIFAFFPSILFWSSIIGKDPLMLLSISIYCYGVIELLKTNKLISSLVILFIGLLSAMFIRSWLGIILGLPIFIVSVSILKNIKVKIFLTVLIASFMLLAINRSADNLGLKSVKYVLDIANLKVMNFSGGGSIIKSELPSSKMPLENIYGGRGQESGMGRIKFRSYKDMFIYLPRGMFTVLFRPLPGEVTNLFGLLAGLEDVFLLFLFVFALIRWKWSKLREPVLQWAILLVVIWAAAYSYVGFNFGTVVRYRVQILPIFLALLLYLTFERGSVSNDQIINKG